MMLSSDLRALKNVARTKEGRSALVGQLIVIVCVVAASIGVSSGSLLGDVVLDTVSADTSGALWLGFHALTLVMPLLLVMGMGTFRFGHELFGASHVPLLLTAPISSLTIVSKAYLRTLLGWLALCVAIGAPPMVGLLTRSSISLTAVLMYPLAVLILLAPLVGAQAMFRILTVRFAAGPRFRLGLMTAHVLLCFVLAFAVLMGFFDGRGLGDRIGGWLKNGGECPWILGVPASLLNLAAGQPYEASLLFMNPVILLSTGFFLSVGAALYRRAYESFVVNRSPKSSPSSRARPWPSSPMGSLLRKGLLESIRVRSNLVAYAFLLVLMVIVIRFAATAAPENIEDPVPASLRQGLALVFKWHGIVLLISTLGCISFIGEEQKQVPLFATSPVSMGTLLGSKLITMAAPIFMCLLAVLISATWVTEVSLGGLLIFTLASIPIAMGTLGLIATIGTWPYAIQIHSDVPLANSLRSILPVILVGGLGTGGIFSVIKLRGAVVEGYHGRGFLADLGAPGIGLAAIGILWLIGLALFVVGIVLGKKNLQQMLGPQPD